MKVLVTGGGGYIGSFMVKALCDREDEVFVIDSFERGYKDSVDARAKIFEGNILDKDFLKKTLSELDVGAIVHFAGLISVGESVEKPGLYFETNVLGALNIIEEIKEKNVKFIFSSTAAVYGNPTKTPIPEDHPKNPTSPYGMSKLMVEDILSWYNQIYALPYAALRYFNASGASLDSVIGERHNPETHIIPRAIGAALANEPFHLFGRDYNTRDGTCIRDYIHALDLVDSHILALDKMKGGKSLIYNVGTGNGYSNLEVIKMVEEVSGKNISVVDDSRRAGDPDELVADPYNINHDLGFKPQYSDLKTIVKTAWEFHNKKAK